MAEVTVSSKVFVFLGTKGEKRDEEQKNER